MLRIRPAQIRTFQPQADTAFVERVSAYLKVHHAGEPVRLPQGKKKLGELTEEVLREMVRGGILRARRHGIEWKSNLLSFVVLMVTGAPNFDEYEKTAAFLADEEIPVEERLGKIVEQMTDEDWKAVEQKYNPQTWILPMEGRGNE
jgi:hypothetical protein